jgi:uncharacterized YccA/Bax inhibitor family protein
VESHNPVLTRKDAFTVQDLEQMYAAPQRMTLDDVVMKTGLLLGLLVITATVAWVGELYQLAIPAALVGFVLAIVNTFKKEPSPPLILAYAAVEGIFLGAISRVFNDAYPGIAIQAVGGTVLCFGAVLVAFRSGRIRNTPRFQKVIIGAMAGIMALYLVNMLAMLFSSHSLPVINDSTPLGILFSVAVVTIASLSFVLDFDMIEKAIAQGAPEKFSWKASFGLVVGLVWLYLEMLRLLAKLRDN